MDLLRLVLAVCLAAIVPVNMYFQARYSRAEHRLRLFRKHFACHGLDWLFVFFNFFWIYSVVFNYSWWLFAFIMSFIINSVSHHYLANMKYKKRDRCHMFDRKKKKILPAGFAHYIFATIETFLLIVFIFSNVISIAAYVACVIMLIFFASIPFGSKKMHGKVIPYDWVFFGSGFISILVKLIFMLI